MPLVQTNAHNLYYSDSSISGPPSKTGLTFIFIHGLGASQNYYFPIIPNLTSTHRCIAVDTYGSARSSYSDEPVSILSITKDMIGVLDALHVPQAVVVGHSMGGLVAIELAARYPDRVQGVIVLGPTHPSDRLVSIMAERAGRVLDDGMDPMANSLPNASAGSRCTVLQTAFIRELLLGQNPKGYAALCRAIASAESPDYAAVHVPFLLIAGDEDKNATMEGCQHVFENVSSKKKSLEVLHGVGYWYCIEASEEVSVLITRFAGEVVMFELEGSKADL